MTQQKIGHVYLSDWRIAFAHGLWTAQQVQGQGRPAFSASFLASPNHPDINQGTIDVSTGQRTGPSLMQVFQQVAHQKWGDQGDAILQSLIAGGRICLRDGNAKPDIAGYPGNYFISARSPTKPLVIDQNQMPVDETAGVIYSGAYVNVRLAIWAQQNQHGRRINAQLQGVQKLRDGEPLSGGAPAAVEDFGVIADSAQANAEFGGNLAGGQPADSAPQRPQGQPGAPGAVQPQAPAQPAQGQPQNPPQGQQGNLADLIGGNS